MSSLNLNKYFGKLLLKRSSSLESSSMNRVVLSLSSSNAFANRIPLKQSSLSLSTSSIKCKPMIFGSNNYQIHSDYQKTLKELDYQLDEVKVFQDEQIIQLSLKSGNTLNFTMAWLRNLCSCSDCQSQRLEKVSKIVKSGDDGGNGSSNELDFAKTSIVDGKLNVCRVRCGPSSHEFVIEWLSDDYRIHRTIYDLKHLLAKQPFL